MCLMDHRHGQMRDGLSVSSGVYRYHFGSDLFGPRSGFPQGGRGVSPGARLTRGQDPFRLVRGLMDLDVVDVGEDEWQPVVPRRKVPDGAASRPHADGRGRPSSVSDSSFRVGFPTVPSPATRPWLYRKPCCIEGLARKLQSRCRQPAGGDGIHTVLGVLGILGALALVLCERFVVTKV